MRTRHIVIFVARNAYTVVRIDVQYAIIVHCTLYSMPPNEPYASEAGNWEFLFMILQNTYFGITTLWL